MLSKNDYYKYGANTSNIFHIREMLLTENIRNKRIFGIKNEKLLNKSPINRLNKSPSATDTNLNTFISKLTTENRELPININNKLHSNKLDIINSRYRTLNRKNNNSLGTCHLISDKLPNLKIENTLNNTRNLRCNSEKFYFGIADKSSDKQKYFVSISKYANPQSNHKNYSIERREIFSLQKNNIRTGNLSRVSSISNSRSSSRDEARNIYKENCRIKMKLEKVHSPLNKDKLLKSYEYHMKIGDKLRRVMPLNEISKKRNYFKGHYNLKYV